MTKRGRLRLVIAVIVLGLPALLIGLVLWYIGSGRLARQLEARWQEHYAGALHIGAMQLDGLGSASVTDLALHDDAGQPLLVLPSVSLSGAFLSGSLSGLSGKDARLSIAPTQQQTVVDIIEAIVADVADMERDSEAGPFSLSLTNTSLIFAQRELHGLDFTLSDKDQVLSLTMRAPWLQLDATIAADNSVLLELANSTLAPQELAQLTADFGYPLPFEIALLPPAVDISALRLALDANGRVQSGQVTVALDNWRSINEVTLTADRADDALAARLNIALSDEQAWQIQVTDLDGTRPSISIADAPLGAGMLREFFGDHIPPWLPADLTLQTLQLTLDRAATPTPTPATPATPAAQPTTAAPLHITGNLALRSEIGSHGVQSLAVRNIAIGLNESFALAPQDHSSSITITGVDGRNQFAADVLLQHANGTLNVQPSGTVYFAEVMRILRDAGINVAIPPALVAIIPPQVSFDGTNITATVHELNADIAGSLALQWPQGGLATSLNGTLLTPQLTDLTLEHGLLGRFVGEMHLGTESLQVAWKELKPNPITLGAQKSLFPMPSMFEQHVAQFILALQQLLPVGQIEVPIASPLLLLNGSQPSTLSSIPAGSVLRLQGDGAPAASVQIDDQQRWTLTAQALPLDLLKILDPQFNIQSGSLAQLRVDIQQQTRDGATTFIPQRASINLQDIAGEWQGWQGSVEALHVTGNFSADAPFAVLPSNAEVRMQGVHGARNGWEIHQDVADLAISRTKTGYDVALSMPERTGMVTFSIDGERIDQGQLSAGRIQVTQVSPQAWMQGLRIISPDAGQLPLHLLPFGEAMIEGAVVVKPGRADDGMDGFLSPTISLNDWELTNLNWAPVAQGLALKLDGIITLKGSDVLGDLSGSLVQGQMQLNDVALDIAQKQPRVNASFSLINNRIVIDPLRLEVQQSERKPLSTSAEIDYNVADQKGRAELKIDRLNLDTIDFLRQALSIPEDIKIQGDTSWAFIVEHSAEQVSGMVDILQHGTDVDIMHGHVQINGLKGRLRLIALPRRRNDLQPIKE